MQKEFKLNFLFYLMAFLPISIIIGSSFSLLNIFLIIVLFIIFHFSQKETEVQNRYVLNFFIVLYIYLLINTFLGIDFENSYLRNFGFARFIILFFAINYFFIMFLKFNNLLNIWLVIISIVTFDCFYEVIFGSNIFGWGEFEDASKQGQRLVSFFKDEPIVGSYLFSFFLILSGYILETNFKNKQIYFTLFFLLMLLIILLSGERSNFLKAIIASCIFLFVSKDISKKYIIKLILFLSVLFVIVFNTNSYLKDKYSYLLKFFSIEKNKVELKKNIYFELYKSGYLVFLDHKLFGVGQKNYGKYASIKDVELKKANNTTISFLIISTHPHQIYIEFLSEHGILGTIILLGLFFYIFYEMIRIIILSRNNIQIGCFCYLVSYFIPVLPSGSFFSDFNATLFWVNFSIFFAVSKKTNFFKLK